MPRINQHLTDEQYRALREIGDGSAEQGLLRCLELWTLMDNPQQALREFALHESDPRGGVQADD